MNKKFLMRRAVALSSSVLMILGFCYSQEAGRVSLRLAYGLGLLKGNQSISWTELIYQEEASYSVNYDVGKGHSFLAGIGYRFSETVGIELGLDLASRNLSAVNRILVPHPLYLDSPREADSSERSGMTENAVSLDIMYRIPLGVVELDVCAGPAVLFTSAELTSVLTFTESAYPYDTVSVDSQTKKLNKSALGLSAGTSLDIHLSKGVAVSMSARYLLAKAHFRPSPAIPQLNLALGGLKLGGGLKLVF